MIEFLNEALHTLAPQSTWSHKGDLSTLEWHTPDIDRPTDSAILATAAELEAAEPERLRKEKILNLVRRKAELEAASAYGDFTSEIAEVVAELEALSG